MLTLYIIGDASSSRKKLKFEHDEPNQPICEQPPHKYTAEQIIKMLIDPDQHKICHVKPTSVTKSATYSGCL